MIGSIPLGPRILAIDPASRGFGYVVMEGPYSLVDWGVRATLNDKSVRSLAKVMELIRLYDPEYLILENGSGPASRRCRRIEKLLKAIHNLALNNQVKVRFYSRLQIRKAFLRYQAVTKYEIALAIARTLPELMPQLPPYRKPWMSEDHRMHIFDAASLAMTFFVHYSDQKRSL